MLGLLSFVLHLTLTRELDRLGVFDQGNVLFDADPDTRLASLSDGLHLGIKHPNLMAYFTPPITLAAKLVIALSPGDKSESAMRRTLGTWLVPSASALTTAIVFSLFGHLGFSVLRSVVATLLASLSFSTLVFGSIPESYGLTALALAVAYAFAANPSRDHRRPWAGAGWIAIGVFATGITVINVVFVALLMAGAVWTEARRSRAIFRVAVTVIAIFGLTGACAWVLDAVMVRPNSTPAADVEAALVERTVALVRAEMTRFAAPDPIRQLLHFPTTLANTFAAPAPDRQPIKPSRHAQGFTLKSSPSIFGMGDPFGTSVFILLVAGALCGLVNDATRGIALASVGIIVFSAMLGVWGVETFLYSQNWNLAAVVLMTGVMRTGPGSRPMTAVVASVTLIVGVRNIALLRDLLDALAAAST